MPTPPGTIPPLRLSAFRETCDLSAKCTAAFSRSECRVFSLLPYLCWLKSQVPIKRLRLIIRWIVALVFGAYLCVLFLLNFAPTKRGLTTAVANALSQKIGSEVSIGAVDVGLFDRILLTDLRVNDRQGRLLLEGHRVTAKADIGALLSGRVSLRTLSLLDASIHLCRDAADAEPNFAFIADAFKADSTQASALNLRINSLVLRRVALTWDENFRPQTPGRFNTAHLAFSDINANLSLKRLTPDSINARLRSFTLRERSGLAVDNLTLRLTANRRNATVQDFSLRLPHSHIEQESASLTYDLSANSSLLHTLSANSSGLHATIATADLAFIEPRLGTMEETLQLSSKLQLRNKALEFSAFNLSNTDGTLLASGRGILPNLERNAAEASLHIAQLRADAPLLAKVGSLLGSTAANLLKRLGSAHYSGAVALNTDHGHRLTGLLQTECGQMDTDLSLDASNKLAGTVKAEDLKLAELLGRTDVPQQLSLTWAGRLNVKAPLQNDAQSDLSISKMEYGNHTFENIRLTAQIAARRLTAQLQSANPQANLTAHLSGICNGRHLTEATLSTDIQALSPTALQLTDRFGNATFAGRVRAYLPSTARTEGEVHLTDFCMTDADSVYAVKDIRLSVAPDRLRLESDFASAEVKGNTDIGLIKPGAEALLARALPGLAEAKPATGGKWDVRARLQKTDFLNRLFRIPLALKGAADLRGTFRTDGGRTSLVLHTEGFSYDGFGVDDARVYLRGEADSLSCLVQGRKRIAGQDIQLVADAKTTDGALSGVLKWDDSTHHTFGTLSLLTRFHNAGRELSVDVRPTTFALGDTVWTIDPSRLTYSDQDLAIHNFSLHHSDQSLSVTGHLSASPSDSIVARLQKVNVEYVLRLANFHAVDFAGEATGRAVVSSRDGNAKLWADIEIPDFLFNYGPMGHLKLKGGFDFGTQQIDLDGHMRDADGSSTDAAGYVNLKRDDMLLDIQAHNTNLRCLQPYLKGFLNNFEGRTTGNVRVVGPLKAIDLTGEADAWAEAEVKALGTTYRVSEGHVVLTPGQMAFSHFKVNDRSEGTGTAEGVLRHTHLGTMHYGFNFTADRLLIYDQPKNLSSVFYATAYGTGTMAVEGHPGTFSADMSMRPEAGTSFTYTIDAPDDFSNIEFVRFGERSESARPLPAVQDAAAAESAARPVSEPEATTDVRLNMLFDVNPNANVRVIMDEKTGDAINVRGNGPIRASYYNKGAFQMYGTYTVSEGHYKMSIQNAIRKDFSFTEGSRIIFTGDPLRGELDMQAVYTVNSASLADLNIGNVSSSTTRVNCLLNFRGQVSEPEVNFDLDLPNVNDDEKQMVRNLIATEEDMNMQIIYLLGVGRFYTPNYSQMATAGNETQTGAAMKSFLSSTLSSQLNDIISNAMGTSNWSFGANVATGSLGTNTMEVEGLLSGRLFNNRLLLNGNFGYRDRTYNSTNFVGDFDAQYLLTPGGTVRLKAYSETNDRYFTKSALTTQGVGLLLRRDFRSLRDLLRPNSKRQKSIPQQRQTP